mgnify:CR=1 FL=1
MTDAEMRREQRRLAKERNFYLWYLKLDGRQRQQPTGCYEVEGPLPPMCYAELLALLSRWEKEGLI